MCYHWPTCKQPPIAPPISHYLPPVQFTLLSKIYLLILVLLFYLLSTYLPWGYAGRGGGAVQFTLLSKIYLLVTLVLLFYLLSTYLSWGYAGRAGTVYATVKNILPPVNSSTILFTVNLFVMRIYRQGLVQFRLLLILYSSDSSRIRIKFKWFSSYLLNTSLKVLDRFFILIQIKII